MNGFDHGYCRSKGETSGCVHKNPKRAQCIEDLGNMLVCLFLAGAKGIGAITVDEPGAEPRRWWEWIKWFLRERVNKAEKHEVGRTAVKSENAQFAETVRRG